MTLDYKEHDMSLIEESSPLMGYFEPDGEFIDFSTLLDVPTHDGDATIPPVYEFLNWVSYIIKDTDYKTFGNTDDREYLKYPGIDEVVKRGYEYDYGYNSCNIEEFKKSLDIEVFRMENIIRNNKINDKYNLFDKWRYNILLFFQKAYSKRPFFEAIARQIKVDNPDAYIERQKKYYGDYFFRDYQKEYGQHICKMIINDNFKDICVQYLGYDSLERFSPDGRLIKPPVREYILTDGPTNFQKTPRVITTSAPNPNERFYNYLLMNWDLHIIPRYIFNENKGVYEVQPKYMNYHLNTKEENYQKEIKSIKKLVRLENRYKYFR